MTEASPAPDRSGSSTAIRIVSGTPTDEETAAIAAVFVQVALERAASTQPLPAELHPSAWQRSARALRTPLQRGATWQDR